MRFHLAWGPRGPLGPLGPAMGIAGEKGEGGSVENRNAASEGRPSENRGDKKEVEID